MISVAEQPCRPCRYLAAARLSATINANLADPCRYLDLAGPRTPDGPRANLAAGYVLYTRQGCGGLDGLSGRDPEKRDQEKILIPCGKVSDGGVNCIQREGRQCRKAARE